MRSTTTALLVVIVALAACICGMGAAIKADQRARARQFEDRVFYTHFGAVYCGNMAFTDCGLRLWNCSDERVYECLHEVAWKDVKP